MSVDTATVAKIASLARLKLLITRRDFTGAVALLQTMEDRFGGGFRPPPASRGAAFAEFLNSPEYQKWKALHPEPPPAPAPPAEQTGAPKKP